MRLAIQVAGSLVAGGLALLLARQAGLRWRRAAGTVAVVPIAVAALLALPALRDATASLIHQRDVNASLSAEQARLEGGSGLGVNVAFLGWAGNHFSAGDTFHLVVGPSAEAASVTQWGLFQLAPHIETERIGAADWLIVYDANIAGYRKRSFGPFELYSPGFGIARNKNAG